MSRSPGTELDEQSVWKEGESFREGACWMSRERGRTSGKRFREPCEIRVSLIMLQYGQVGILGSVVICDYPIQV